jgi:catechol 2,3-dioxygenase-like lactoylglutathione lyase family enzyme
MRVRGIRWVGVDTTHVTEMRAFAIDVLGLRIDGEDGDDFVELAMADGSKLELFGSPAVADGPWLFEADPVVAGFLVDDIHYAWQHFRAPDGHVYELTADPAAIVSTNS